MIQCRFMILFARVSFSISLRTMAQLLSKLDFEYERKAFQKLLAIMAADQF